MNSKNSILEIKLTDLDLPKEAYYFDISEPQSIEVLKEIIMPSQNANFIKFGLFKIRESTRYGETTNFFIELFTNCGIIESLMELLPSQDNQIVVNIILNLKIV